MTSRLTRRKISANLILTACGVGLFWVFAEIGFSGEWGGVASIKVGPALGFFAFTILGLLCCGLRWSILTSRITGGVSVRFSRLLHYLLMSRVAGFILPKGITDIGSRSVLLNHFHAVGISRAATSVLVDRVLDLVTIVTLLVFSLPFWLGWTGFLATLYLELLGATAAGVLVYFAFGRLVRFCIRCLHAMRRLVRGGKETTEAIPADEGEVEIGGRPKISLYALSLAKVGCNAARYVFLAQALNLAIDPALVMLSTPAGQTAYMVSLTPGGIGIVESGWFAVLTAGGVSSGQAGAFVVAQRILTTAVLGTMAALSWLCRRGLRSGMTVDGRPA